jgi:phenylalanyl-tRNA synthetase beta chain
MSFLHHLKLILFGHVPPPREKKGSPLIVTARVDKVEQHPNADRLRIARLNTGSTIVSPVVCGALNFKEGDVVALALPGAKIARNIHSEAHESFVLEKATIRGVESQGMICAGFEIGFTDVPETREEGVWVFPEGTKVGEDVYKIFSR